MRSIRWAVVALAAALLATVTSTAGAEAPCTAPPAPTRQLEYTSPVGVHRPRIDVPIDIEQATVHAILTMMETGPTGGGVIMDFACGVIHVRVHDRDFYEDLRREFGDDPAVHISRADIQQLLSGPR